MESIILAALWNRATCDDARTVTEIISAKNLRFPAAQGIESALAPLAKFVLPLKSLKQWLCI